MEYRKPAWWQLVLLIPIMFGLLALEHVVPLPGISDAYVDGGIVILTFAALFVWTWWNSGRLEWYYVDKDESLRNLKVTVYEPVSKMQDAEPQSEDSALVLKRNGNGKNTLDLTLSGSAYQPVRVYRPRSSHRKEKNKWFRS